MKERIKGILNYKRPAFWVILLAVIACVVVAVCFLTNPSKKTEESSTENSTENSSENSSEKERFNKEITQKRKEALEKAKDPENWKTPGEYPVTSKDEIWFYMSADEQRSVVSMPKELQDTLDTMSTGELGLWFINYPFLMEVFMFDSASMGLRKIKQDCRVCETFFKREDANAFLLKYYRELEADKTLQEENAGKYFQDEFLKMYFNEIRDSLSAEEQAELDLVAPSPAIAIDCGESEMYSVEDREAAIKEILLDFNKAAELRKLVNLVYTSDQKCLDNLNYARELKYAKDPGVTLDECIVFSCDYKLSDGTFCIGWNYILGRVKGGNWEILTQGY